MKKEEVDLYKYEKELYSKGYNLIVITFTI